MKIKYFHNLRFSVSKTRFDYSQISAMAFLKGGRPMLGHLVRSVYALGGTITPNWVRLCTLYLRKLNLLYKHGGLPMVVKYLKVASVIIQQVCGGQKLSCLNGLGMRISRSKSGLPRFIPAYQRKLIKRGEFRVIKFWLTLISIFRDLHFLGELKLKTIIDPSTASSDSQEIKKFIKPFTYLLWKGHNNLETLRESAAFQMLTSGPQVDSKEEEFNTHPNSVLRSLNVFLMPENKGILDSLRLLMELTHNERLIQLYHKLVKVRWDKLIYPIRRPLSCYLGKLSIKEEAAGKVRVFAMVDPWTQWVLRPLHDNLFTVLRSLPMDGTFNQLKPLTRVPWKKAPLYSFDLSAATDRLPIWLQRDILSEVFGLDFALAWENLLVSREWLTPKAGLNCGFKVTKDYPKTIKYTVGQPMGALSSWAMLAITHHYIVQYSAWSSGVCPKSKLFIQYGVLGDDFVIWNKTVARVYLQTMKRLGLEINLSKSIVSPKGTALEFAKRTLFEGTDVSPIPFKEQSSAHRSVSLALNFKERFNLTELGLIRFLGYGYKVDPTKPNSLVSTLKLAMSIPKDCKALLAIFSLDRPFLDIGGVSFPLNQVRKTFLSLLKEELLRLRRAETLMLELAAFEVGCYVDSIGPWRTADGTVRAEIVGGVVSKYIKELMHIGLGAKAHLETLHPIFCHYESFMWDTPEILIQPWLKLKPIPRDLLMAINFMFKAQDDLSRIQPRSIMFPTRSESESPEFRESSRLLRIWNRWSRLLSKVKAQI